MAHKKHRGDFKDEDEDEEESEAEEEDVEKSDEDEDDDDEEENDDKEEKKSSKKESPKSSSKSTSKSNKPIKLELVQAPMTYEDAIQFEDGTYVKLNDKDFRIWVINTLLEIKEAIG